MIRPEGLYLLSRISKGTYKVPVRWSSTRSQYYFCSFHFSEPCLKYEERTFLEVFYKKKEESRRENYSNSI